MRKFIATSFLALVLSILGCATPYQPSGALGGFSEIQLAEDAYEINFRGNAYTGVSQASDYALLRAAELCLMSGYEHFVLVDRRDEISTSSYTTPVTSTTTGTAHTTASAYGLGNYAYGNANTTYSSNTTYSGGQTLYFNKPRTNLIVQFLREKPEGVFAYNARLVYSSIARKWDIPTQTFAMDRRPIYAEPQLAVEQKQPEVGSSLPNNDAVSNPDAVASFKSQLVVTTRTPDTVDPVVVQQIDGKKISQTQSSLVSAMESYNVEPGLHQIVVAPQSDSSNEKSMTIDVKPGVKYYLGWHESEPAIWKEESN